MQFFELLCSTMFGFALRFHSHLICMPQIIQYRNPWIMNTLAYLSEKYETIEAMAAASSQQYEDWRRRWKPIRSSSICIELLSTSNLVGSEIGTLVYIYAYHSDGKKERPNKSDETMIISFYLEDTAYAYVHNRHTLYTLNKSRKIGEQQSVHISNVCRWNDFEFNIATINQESRRIERSKQWDYNCRQNRIVDSTRRKTSQMMRKSRAGWSRESESRK